MSDPFAPPPIRADDLAGWSASSPAAQEYLTRLSEAALVLPRGQREALTRLARGHLCDDQGHELTGDAAEAGLRSLGSPEVLVLAAMTAGKRAMPASSSLAREWWAAIASLFGVLGLGIGWIAGLVLLVRSSRWNGQDKAVGALMLMGGLGFALLLDAAAGGRSHRCETSTFASTTTYRCTTFDPSDPSWLIGSSVALAAGLAAAAYLIRKAYRVRALEPSLRRGWV